MSVAGVRNRDSFGAVSGAYRILSTDSGLIPLVPAPLRATIYIQKIHVQVTTGAGGALWTFQDGAGIPIARSLSAGAIAHFDLNYGPDGVPCTEATAFVLNVTGGAVGWVTWSAYQQLTRSAAATRYADLVLADRPLAYWRLNDAEGYAQAVLRDAPSSYWRLNEPSGLTAVDLVGGKNGTISGGVTLNQPGALASGDKAMAFDGTTGNVAFATVAMPATPTFEAWIYRTGAGTSANPRIWSCAPTYTFEVAVGQSTGTLQFYLAFTDATASAWQDTGAVVSFGQWHHVALTWDGTWLRAYLDGVQITALNTWAGKTLNSAPGASLCLSGQSVAGSLDEIAIYPVVLTAQQIANHYALRTSIIATVTPAIAVDLIGGKNGTISGGVTLNQPGALASGDKAMAFDGTTGYLVLANSGSSMDIPGAVTLEAWVKLSNSPNNDGWIISRAGITVQDYALHVTTIDGGVTNRVSFNYLSTPGGWIDTPGAVVPRGVWAHLAATRDAPGTLISYYLNGVLTGTVPGGGLALSPAPARNIGYDPGTPGFFKGSLDEVAIYPYALTAQQILAHFQAASRP